MWIRIVTFSLGEPLAVRPRALGGWNVSLIDGVVCCCQRARPLTRSRLTATGPGRSCVTAGRLRVTLTELRAIRHSTTLQEVHRCQAEYTCDQTDHQTNKFVPILECVIGSAGSQIPTLCLRFDANQPMARHLQMTLLCESRSNV